MLVEYQEFMFPVFGPVNRAKQEIGAQMYDSHFVIVSDISHVFDATESDSTSSLNRSTELSHQSNAVFHQSGDLCAEFTGVLIWRWRLVRFDIGRWQTAADVDNGYRSSRFGFNRLSQRLNLCGRIAHRTTNSNHSLASQHGHANRQANHVCETHR